MSDGIAAGLCPPIANQASAPVFLDRGFAAAGCLVLAGIVLVRLERVALGAVASLLSWILLGVLGAGIAQQPLPPDHVVTLLDGDRIDLHSPLRWHGRLRDEPARLPWGYGYEIELAGVEYQNALVPLRGGMRLGFTPHPGEAEVPELHAGDEIAVLTKPKRPQVFRDDGAFDRRAYLATQNIDLVATLRAPELIERVSTPRPTAATLLARARRRLRDEVDLLFGGAGPVAGVLRALLLGDRSFVD